MPRAARGDGEVYLGLERWRHQGIASNRDRRFLTVFLKLTAGTTVDQARAELSSLAAQLASSYPNTNAE